MKKLLVMVMMLSCMSLVALSEDAQATPEQDVATMQHPDGPQHNIMDCRICR